SRLGRAERYEAASNRSGSNTIGAPCGGRAWQSSRATYGGLGMTPAAPCPPWMSPQVSWPPPPGCRPRTGLHLRQARHWSSCRRNGSATGSPAASSPLVINTSGVFHSIASPPPLIHRSPLLIAQPSFHPPPAGQASALEDVAPPPRVPMPTTYRHDRQDVPLHSANT